jgi:hypothetical protein
MHRFLLVSCPLLALLLLLLSAGCDSLGDESDLFFMRATVNGQPWEGEAFGGFRNDTLLILGQRQNNGTEQIVIVVPDYAGPEVYEIGERDGLYAVAAAADTTFYWSLDAESNEFILESLDLDAIIGEGTFRFSARAEDGDAEVTVTEGRFRTRIQASFP